MWIECLTEKRRIATNSVVEPIMVHHSTKGLRAAGTNECMVGSSHAWKVTGSLFVGMDVGPALYPLPWLGHCSLSKRYPDLCLRSRHAANRMATKFQQIGGHILIHIHLLYM
ncbi:unnamed protein product [Camellia sinensis]